MSDIGLPGLNGFIGEFLVLLGTFITHRWWAVVATTGWCWGPCTSCGPTSGSSTARPRPSTPGSRDMTWAERLAVAPLLAGIIFIGVYPQPLLTRIQPAVDHLVAHVEYADPELEDPLHGRRPRHLRRTARPGGRPAARRGRRRRQRERRQPTSGRTFLPRPPAARSTPSRAPFRASALPRARIPLRSTIPPCPARSSSAAAPWWSCSWRPCSPSASTPGCGPVSPALAGWAPSSTVSCNGQHDGQHQSPDPAVTMGDQLFYDHFGAFFAILFGCATCSGPCVRRLPDPGGPGRPRALRAHDGVLLGGRAHGRRRQLHQPVPRPGDNVDRPVHHDCLPPSPGRIGRGGPQVLHPRLVLLGHIHLRRGPHIRRDRLDPVLRDNRASSPPTQCIHTGVLLAGMGLVIVGLGFKVAAVPFHFWSPDVYQGAPTPFVGYMAAVAKAGGFAGLVRVLMLAPAHRDIRTGARSYGSWPRRRSWSAPCWPWSRRT